MQQFQFMGTGPPSDREEEEPRGEERQPEAIWDTKEYLDVLKHYGDDDNIPKEVKKSKWAIFGRALTYTFLEEKDLPMIDIFSNILRIDSLITQPPHRITFGEVEQLDQTQAYFFFTAKRAIGTTRDKMNERTLQNTQIGQSIATQTGGGQQRSGGGFFSKVRGAL